MDDRIRTIKRASLLSVVGNAALATAKIATGYFAGSLAVLGDGIDSSTDVVVSFISLVAARVAGKPGDREHPYGHGRAETIATVVLAFALFYAGTQLALGAAGSLLSGEERAEPSILAVWVTLASIIGKLFLAWSQFAAGKRVGSTMLIANGKNMRSDVVISCGVLAGIVVVILFDLHWLDAAFALAIGLWVVRAAVSIFLEANNELMDGTDSGTDLYKRVFEAIATVEGAGNPHRTRVRKLAERVVVDTDIEVDPDLTVSAAHDIAMRVEAAIKRDIDEVYDVLVHVEPRGNVERDERYGRAPGDEGSGTAG